MSAGTCPADAREVAEAVAQAAAAWQKLHIVGGGSKQGYGRPVEAEQTLDVSRLWGIVEYEPAELYITAQAATPLAEIERLLAEHGQLLAFETPDWGRLLHGTGAPTLGGTIACNMAGPRRVRAGAARDHFLGFSAVDGRGDIWKAGGRVVKNVTGYDMCKLQAGAFGTLSVLLEITVRALPRPETSCSVVFSGLSDEDGIGLLARALNTPHEVSAASHLPAMAGNAARTVLRLEGPHPSVAFRASALEALHPSAARMGPEESASLWADIGAVQPFLQESGSIVWRICVPPAAAPSVLRDVRNSLEATNGFYDWGGGLLWLEIFHAAPEDAGAAIVRAAVRRTGGHATLLRADRHVRAHVPVFEPAAAPLEALTRRVKSGFDPLGILNPGRMQHGV